MEFVSLGGFRPSRLSSFHVGEDVSAGDSNWFARHAVNDGVFSTSEDSSQLTKRHVVTDLPVSFQVDLSDGVVGGHFTFAEADHQVSSRKDSSKRAVLLKHNQDIRVSVSHHFGGLSAQRVDSQLLLIVIEFQIRDLLVLAPVVVGHQLALVELEDLLLS